jgi:hypothetical protein
VEQLLAVEKTVIRKVKDNDTKEVTEVEEVIKLERDVARAIADADSPVPEAVSIPNEDDANGIDQPISNRLATDTAIDGDTPRQSAIGDESSGAGQEGTPSGTKLSKRLSGTTFSGGGLVELGLTGLVTRKRDHV